MPKKPTSPFGYIAFAKYGTVRREIMSLSSDKQEQESQAVHRFFDLYNEANPANQITALEQLPEAGHDFFATHKNQPVVIQLTELVDRGYTFQMSKEEYDQAKWREAIQKNYGELPWRIDTEKRDMALGDLINRKAERYAPLSGSALWLVVFTTDLNYLVEHSEHGQIIQSAALKNARKDLSSTARNLFSEIWFTNLTTRPVQVWGRASGP